MPSRGLFQAPGRPRTGLIVPKPCFPTDGLDAIWVGENLVWVNLFEWIIYLLLHFLPIFVQIRDSLPT